MAALHMKQQHHQGPTHARRRVACKAGWPAVQLPAFLGGKPKPQRPALVQELLQLTEGGGRGEGSSAADKAEARRLVAALRDELANSAGGAPSTTDASTLTATWRLVWTTEQETLWIARNAGLFGTAAGAIYQVIDVPAGRLQNIITFPPEGAFVVDSGISVAGQQRVAFKFRAAQLQLPQGRTLRLPPFGQGWFDNVYVDADIRIALDIRNDVLVCARDGPPRVFGSFDA